MHPIKHIQNISSTYSGIWNLVEQTIEQKEDIKKDMEMPDWCFLPRRAYMEMLDYGHEIGIWQYTDLPIRERSNIVASFCSLIPWNYTRYIYEFNDDFYQELTKTIFTGNIPREILLKLPVYAIYIKFPEGLAPLANVIGAWVSLQPMYDTDDKMQVDAEGNAALIVNMVLNLDANYTECMELILSEAKTTLAQSLENILKLGINKGEKISYKNHAYFTLIFSDVINCLLYICSQDPDVKDPVWMGEKPGNPKLEKIKGKFRLFPPKKFKTFKVGNEVGRKIRNYNNDSGIREKTWQCCATSYPSRTHWHGYWKGPKKRKRDFED